MKKLFIILIALSSLVFAKENKSYEYVYVEHSEPIYEIRDYKYYEEEPYPQYRHRSEYNSSNQIGLDTVIGATIGIAIGNQLAKGHKRKDVAKVAGGLIGAAMANNARDTYYETHHRAHNPKHYKKRKRRVLVAYKNYFIYENKEYFKITSRPKNRIKVTKTISF